VSKSSKVSDLVFRTDLDSVDVSSATITAALPGVEMQHASRSKNRRFYGVSVKVLEKIHTYTYILF
jgi:hypothetical protein